MSVDDRSPRIEINVREFLQLRQYLNQIFHELNLSKYSVLVSDMHDMTRSNAWRAFDDYFHFNISEMIPGI